MIADLPPTHDQPADPPAAVVNVTATDHDGCGPLTATGRVDVVDVAELDVATDLGDGGATVLGSTYTGDDA